MSRRFSSKLSSQLLNKATAAIIKTPISRLYAAGLKYFFILLNRIITLVIMKYKFRPRLKETAPSWLPRASGLLVALTGLITIDSTLNALVHLRYSRIAGADAHTTLLAGLSLIYLSTLLYRGKRTAWLVSLLIFIFLLARNIRHFDFDLPLGQYNLEYYLNTFLPLAILALLALGRDSFRVRSEVLNFMTAAKKAVLILFVALIYGSIGFQLLD